jgi:ABC-type phosphate transport system substrate-binding protein
MSTSARGIAPSVFLAIAAAAWGLAAAAPAVAEPGDSADTNPTIAGSTALPLMRAVDPVMARVDDIWNQFVPPNAIVPWSPAAAFEQFVEPFIPTTTQVGDVGGFLQQWRSPAVAPYTG